MKSEYKVCPKCGIRHTTLVRHKCPATVDKRASKDCEITEHDINEGTAGKDLSIEGEAKDPGKADSEDAVPGEGEGDGEDGEGEAGDQPSDGEADGEGESDGEGHGDGEGEGDPTDGEGEDGDGEGDGPAPQPPEPEAPPVAVVCTVLKFAALTAACSEAFVKVELGADGLIVVAIRGDHRATAVMPWGEFEKRSTLDGEFWAKDVIDATAREVLEKAEDEGEREPEYAVAGYATGVWHKWDGDQTDDVPEGVDPEANVCVVLGDGKPTKDKENAGRGTPAKYWQWGRIAGREMSGDISWFYIHPND